MFENESSTLRKIACLCLVELKYLLFDQPDLYYGLIDAKIN